MDKTFDLDQLKTSWKNQNFSKPLEDNEIKIALNKKSIQVIKYIFWISIIEFLLIFCSNFVFNETRNLSFLNEEKLKNYQFWNEIMNEIYWINTFISLVFVGLFYAKYKKIAFSLSVSENISRIINFRKTVHFYVIWNLLIGLIYVFTIGNYLFAEPFFSKGIFEDTNFNRVLILVLVSAVIIGITFLYYYLIFGIFLKKLSRNLKELKK